MKPPFSQVFGSFVTAVCKWTGEVRIDLLLSCLTAAGTYISLFALKYLYTNVRHSCYTFLTFARAIFEKTMRFMLRRCHKSVHKSFPTSFAPIFSQIGQSHTRLQVHRPAYSKPNTTQWIFIHYSLTFIRLTFVSLLLPPFPHPFHIIRSYRASPTE